MNREERIKFLHDHKLDSAGLPLGKTTMIETADGVTYRIRPMEAPVTRIYNNHIIPTYYAVFRSDKHPSNRNTLFQVSKWYWYFGCCQNKMFELANLSTLVDE